MMRLIDKYLLGNFVKTLVFALLVFISLFITLNLIEKIDRFMDGVSFSLILSYYVNSIPNIIVLAMPIAMLMAALYTIGEFVKNGELTAVKAGGISLYRLFAPLLMFALVVSGCIFWYGENVVPISERKKDDIWTYDIRKRNRKNYVNPQNVFLQDSDNRFVKIQMYNSNTHEGNNVTIYKMTDDGSKLIYSVVGEKMYYERESWVLRDVIKRDFSTGNEILTKLSSLEFSDLLFTEDDIIRSENDPDKFNIYELKDYIDKQKVIGNNYTKELVDFHHKMAFPLVNFIVVLIGLPLAVNKWGGGAAIGFGLCLLICFLYYFFMSFIKALGYNGLINPYFAAWSSNLLFGIIGLISFAIAKK